ncbi:putative integral membrane protein (TIGR02206 family) [Paenibacillus taihuensis]|uniref:Putative integral membrane protein (TIGR02206 family) n=1 Tax=Paenibacillus taihuensis TaxID=1156355 RepID=A0A3D9RR71_9BACL|nr:TIGR02206 family membrane protein [Paenibacillus taihuensis]REE78915.1 putative integral membrane protein (TIGR02206 family) [Paenibacillus taihuensis]
MGSFFSAHTESHFVAYAAPHLLMIALLLGLALLMFLFRDTVRKDARLRTAIRVLLLIGLAVPEGGLYYWYAVEDLWNARFTLPLELCSISQMLAILMLVTRSRLLYIVVYFAGIGGALQAILTPDLDYPFPHFRFFHFFIVHIAIILSPLYMTWAERYRPTWKSIGVTMIFLNILVIVVGGVDFWLGANYMFLRHKPAGASLLSLLGPYPYYLLVEEAIAVAIFTLMYLPFAFARRRD